MQAVILAGGLGHRLRPFTEIIPKPLLPLGDKSILEIQINRLRACGTTEVFLATNYMSDLVEAFVGQSSRFGVAVHVSKEEKPLGTCGPLALLRDRLSQPFLVMNGDILTKLDFREFYDYSLAQQAALTVATKTIATPFRFGNVEVGPDNTIVSIEEKPTFTLEVVAGIYCMTPRIFDLIPDGQYFGIDGLIMRMLAEKMRIVRYRINDYWLDIGQVEDYTKAREEYQQHFEHGAASERMPAPR